MVRAKGLEAYVSTRWSASCEIAKQHGRTQGFIPWEAAPGLEVPGKGSVTRSVRIEKYADDRLRQLAVQGDTSVNTLVNRALRKFVEWDAYGEKFGFVTMPSVVLVKLMSCLTDQEASGLGQWAGKNLLREYSTFWFAEVTPETLVEGFLKLLSKYGRAFAYEELVQDDRRTIILKHGGGPGWSTFYEEAIRTAFHDLLEREAHLEKSDNQVVVRFRTYGKKPFQRVGRDPSLPSNEGANDNVGQESDGQGDEGEVDHSLYPVVDGPFENVANQKEHGKGNGGGPTQN